MINEDKLKKDFANILNIEGIDNYLDTPDYALANYIIQCLECLENIRHAIGTNNCDSELESKCVKKG